MSERESGSEHDFTSQDFNPLSALYSDSVQIPFPSATQYDNVAVFESSLNPSSRKKTSTAPKDGPVTSATAHESRRGRVCATEGPVSARGPVPSSMATRRKEVFASMGIKPATKRISTKQTKNIWSKLKAGYHEGPLSLLTRCIGEKVLVKVCTRNKHQIRGCCQGYIVAFDKHMNLAMVDVDETYRNPLWQSKSGRRRRRKAAEKQLKGEDKGGNSEDQTPIGKDDSKASEARCHVPMETLNIGHHSSVKGDEASNHLAQPKELKRHVAQLFIRGDSVVTVIPVK